MTRHTAAPIDPSCWAMGSTSSASCCLQECRILDATLTVPSATCRHLVEASAEHMTELLTAVAEHELRRVTKFITHHTRVIASVILECVILIDDHGRVDIGDLLLVFNSKL